MSVEQAVDVHRLEAIVVHLSCALLVLRPTTVVVAQTKMFVVAGHTDQKTYPFRTRICLVDDHCHLSLSVLDGLGLYYNFQARTQVLVSALALSKVSTSYLAFVADRSWLSSSPEEFDSQPPCSYRRNRAQNVRN